MSFKRELSVSLGLCVQSLYEYKRKDGACLGGDASKILPRLRL